MSNQTWKIGDCQDLMREMEPDSVDIIVTDPPYGYSFMGKDWDKVVPSSDIWKEALRVLKPGAFAFIMSAPRQDVLAHNLVNLSDAGFDTGFTSIYWTFASGFPKAGNIGKIVDRRLGAEREVIGKKIKARAKGQKIALPTMGAETEYINIDITKALDGSYSGFQPKPAVEVIMCVMKPLSKSTYVDQALANQKGITWLDDGRIPYQSDTDKGDINRFKGVPMLPPEKGFNQNKVIIDVEVGQNGGRFPANLLVCDDVLNTGQDTKSTKILSNGGFGISKNDYGNNSKIIDYERGFNDSGSFSRYFDLDQWFDTKFLPKEAQKTFPFMIVPKASKSEKGNVEIDNSDKYHGKFPCSKADKNKNKHPTVKPVKLFSWLMTIGSRKGDLVLDPFLGSGTALEAGYLVGRDVLGFDISDEWEHLYAARAHQHQGNLGDWI